MMVLSGGVIVGLAMGRIGVAEDPTTPGHSHLLQGNPTDDPQRCC
jgi:hypothetical protein